MYYASGGFWLSPTRPFLTASVRSSQFFLLFYLFIFSESVVHNKMSGVRKLMQKANSAPPGRLNLPNHGSVEEQLLAIELQKERTHQLEGKLSLFTTKVRKQKDDSKNERHKQQWLLERSSLFKDRQAAQEELDASIVNALQIPSCGEQTPFHLATSAVLQEYRNDLASSQDLASTLLTGMVTLRAKVAASGAKAARSTRDDHTLQEAITTMKAFLAEESRLLELSAVEEPYSRDAMSKMLKELGPIQDSEWLQSDARSTTTAFSMTVEGIERDVDEAIETVKHTFPHSSEEATCLFHAAMCDVVESLRNDVAVLERTYAAQQRDFTVTECTDDDKERVKMLMKAYDPARNPSMMGRTRSELYERIAHDLPHLSVSQAQLVVHKISSERNAKHQRAQLFQKAKATLQNLKASLQAVATAEEDAHAAEAQRHVEQEEEAKRQREYQESIANLRQGFDERQAAKRAAEESAQAEERRKEDAREHKRRREFEARMQQLAQFRQEQLEAEAKKRVVDEQMKAAEAEEQHRRAQHNGERVQARQAAYESKMDDLRLQKLLADEELAAKREAYDRFYASIQEKMGVQRDTDRVLQATVASEQTRGSGYVGAREAVSGKTIGFTAEAIVKDPRFRIHEALVAANLHRTAYARHVMQSSPYSVVRPALQMSAANPFLPSS